MQPQRIRQRELFATLPPEWAAPTLSADIARAVQASGRVVVVLDDDPTGTQTVHGVPVLTEWSTDTLTSVLREADLFYISTNSRALTEADARALNKDVARSLLAASLATGRAFVVVSRSDSTLRGHYPAEVDALAEALGQPFDGHLIVPYFLAGGRFTIRGIHYVLEGGEWLTPAADTEFARDAAFGYHYSDLPHYVQEKSKGRWQAADVVVLDIETIRREGPTGVAARLQRVAGGQPIAVDAASDGDLQVVVAGLLQAEARGQRFLYRTAASFVTARGALTPKGLLTADEMRPPSDAARGGLVAFGSYVRRSTEQWEQARQLDNIAEVELVVADILLAGRCDGAVQRAKQAVDEALAAGRDVLLYTSRGLVTGKDAAASLNIGQQVSAALVDVVRGLTQKPRFFVAKGGITSIDLAKRGLGMRKALVLGQILPGVPVWQMGPESRWPGMVYVVFPGNVGGPDAVAEAIRRLRGQPATH